MTSSLENIRSSIETLANENEKARDTIEKLSTLDQTINDIDVRMQNLHKARVWLAELETRLDEKYREVKQQIKLAEKIIGKGKIDNETLSLESRDDVIRLKKQGWTVDDIVKSLKISRAAVELILETATR
jgi:transcriptional regulator